MDKNDVSQLNKAILSLQYYITTIPYFAVCIGAVAGLMAIIPMHAETVTDRLFSVFIGAAIGFFISRVITKILGAIVIILQHQVELIYRLPEKVEEAPKPTEDLVVVEKPAVEAAVEVKSEPVVEAPKETDKGSKKVAMKRKPKA